MAFLSQSLIQSTLPALVEIAKEWYVFLVAIFKGDIF